MTAADDLVAAREFVDEVAAVLVEADDDLAEVFPGHLMAEAMRVALELTQPRPAAVLAALSGAARTVREAWMQGYITPVAVVKLLEAATVAALDDLEALAGERG